MTIEGTNLDTRMARIVLKGGGIHHVPFGAKTAVAIDRICDALGRGISTQS
jgi:hypothetical protein